MSRIKITLNAPAKAQFFDSVAGEITGIRINIIDKQVFIRPTTELEKQADPNNIVESQDRERGGAQAFLEGSRVKELLTALYNPTGLPYFLLNRVENGWIQCVPFLGSGTNPQPGRFVPHLRIWDLPKDPKSKKTAEDLTNATSSFSVEASLDVERTRGQLRILRTMLEAAENPGYTELQMNQLLARASSFIATVPPIPTQAERDEADWNKAAPKAEPKAPATAAPKPVEKAPKVAAAPAPEPETVAEQPKRPSRRKPQPEPEVRAAMMRPLSPVSPEAAPPRKSKVDLQPVSPAPATSTRKGGFDVSPKQQPHPVAARGSSGSRRRQMVFGMS